MTRLGLPCPAAHGCLVLVLVLLGGLRARAAAAQHPAPGAAPLAGLCEQKVTAGSAGEQSMLLAALARGRTPSFSIRPLPNDDVAQLFESIQPARGVRRCPRRLLPVSTQLWYNVARARPDRDGAVWQGRGLTASASAGVTAAIGPFDLVLRPIAVWSQNRAFAPLIQPATAGDLRDPVWGAWIDLPARFGLRPFRSLEPGESHVRVKLWRAALGVTTEGQSWGPASFYPLVFSTEAAGVPRAYVAARSVPLLIGTGAAHWQLGLLEASPFSGLSPGGRSRVLSALVAAFRPRFLSAVELGGSRVFHVRGGPSRVSWATATLPFSGLVKTRSAAAEARVGGYNQLASFFTRVSPGGGVEVYGELYREDHNANSRDLIGEPDHQSAYTLGLRRAWSHEATVSAMTFERVNGRITHLARVRGQGPMYTHSQLTEGHTFRGQPLGSVAALGGGSMAASWSRIEPARSWTVTTEIGSAVQDGEGGTFRGRMFGQYRLEALYMRAQGLGSRGAGVGLEVWDGWRRSGNLTVHFRYER